MPRTRQSDPLLTQTASEKFNLIDLIPMYDGGESLGIRRFLEKINDVANLGKWSNDEKVTILKFKLAGIAEEFFLSDPIHSKLTEYNDIARILIGRFEKAVPLSTHLQLFSSHVSRVLLRAYKNSQHASPNWEHRYSSQEIRLKTPR
ncbi:hypothetical protein TNCV_1376981 [Trichonephila clavipes]|nr:hypothetical protein TNCV_1376981 [Trichonephila clavipes]